MGKNLLKETFEKIKLNELRKVNHERLMGIISEKDMSTEHGQERNNIIHKINNNEYEAPNANSYYISLNKSNHKAMLSDYTVEELAQMKLFKLKNYNIGFALKNIEGKGYVDIVAVHNNEPYITQIGDYLIQSAVKNGGKYLDHFDGYLSQFYEKNGFKEIGRDEYDPTYDPDGNFRNKYGEQPVIYRAHHTVLSQQ